MSAWRFIRQQMLDINFAVLWFTSSHFKLSVVEEALRKILDLSKSAMSKHPT